MNIRFFIFLTITTFLAMPQVVLCYNTATLEFVKKHKKLPGTTVADRDLSYANLAGIDLSHARLPGVDLKGADLSSTKFCYADLSGALFRFK